MPLPSHISFSPCHPKRLRCCLLVHHPRSECARYIGGSPRHSCTGGNLYSTVTVTVLLYSAPSSVLYYKQTDNGTIPCITMLSCRHGIVCLCRVVQSTLMRMVNKDAGERYHCRQASVTHSDDLSRTSQLAARSAFLQYSTANSVQSAAVTCSH